MSTTDQPSALILFPAQAESYSYHPIVSRIDTQDPASTIMMISAPSSNPQLREALFGDAPPECDHFMWGKGDDFCIVNASQIHQWVVAEITCVTQEELEYKVRYQCDRLGSGLHPFWTSGVPRTSEIS